MKLSIVLVNYNTPQDVLDVVASLNSATIPKDLQVDTILVDSASTDNSVSIFKSKLKHLKLITSTENLGFAGGNNLGIKQALLSSPDVVLLLNPDTIVPKSFFTDFLKSAISRPEVGLLTPKIYFAKGYEFHKDRYKKQDLGKVIWGAGGVIDWANLYGSNAHVDEVDDGSLKQSQTDFATGACLFIKREVLEQVGLIDERYFLYLEDLEFSLRAKRHGWQIVFDPTIYIWHKVSQSSGIGSSLNDYFITRNRLLLGFTYSSLRTRIALLREAFRFLISNNHARRIAVLDFLTAKFGPGSWLK